MLKKRLNNRRRLLVRIEKSYADRFHQYFPLVVSLLALLLNFLVVYFTAWPHYKAEILHPDICFDDRAISAPAFLDSMYVQFDVYNSGNRPISILETRITIKDPKDTNIFILQKRLKAPPLISPGEISPFLYSIRGIREWHQKDTRSMFYSLPRSDSDYIVWKSVYKAISEKPLFPISHNIILRIHILYTDNQLAELEIPVNQIRAISIQNPYAPFP